MIILFVAKLRIILNKEWKQLKIKLKNHFPERLPLA